MAELISRGGYEMDLARALARLMTQQGKTLFEALGSPPDISKITPEIWAQLQQETGALLLPQMEQIYLAAAEQALGASPIGVDWGLVNEQAARWAATHTSDLLAGLNNTTRNAVQQKLEAHFRTGAPLSELKKSLASVLGPTRAELIAVTEITRAASQGQMQILGELRKAGVQMEAVWNTAADERVCPICQPLNGLPQGDNWSDPPPAHGRCRCWVSLRFVSTGVEI